MSEAWRRVTTARPRPALAAAHPGVFEIEPRVSERHLPRTGTTFTAEEIAFRAHPIECRLVGPVVSVLTRDEIGRVGVDPVDVRIGAGGGIDEGVHVLGLERERADDQCELRVQKINAVAADIDRFRVRATGNEPGQRRIGKLYRREMSLRPLAIAK